MAAEIPFEIKPLAISKTIRNSVVPNINYTAQDYNSLLQRMLELIHQNYPKEFNEFNESSLAVMLLQMWAYLGDQLSFKIDQICNELFIDTVTEPANAMRLAALVGFKPTPPLPARAMFSGMLTHPLTYDLPIQTPILVDFISSRGTSMMELFAADHQNNPLWNDPIIIPAGQTSTNAIIGIEGKTNKMNSSGTGLPYQTIQLESSRVLWKSTSVSVNGEIWREVEFFSESSPRPEYRVEIGKDYSATILFGNNIGGIIPPKGSNIQISYRTGGGTHGNVSTGGVAKNVTVYTNDGNSIICRIQNFTRGEGGYDGDTIEDIRMKLPLYLKSQNRAVTGADYKALVDTYASSTNGLVGKSVVVLRNHGCAANLIDIYVLARDGFLGLTKASDNLKHEIGLSLSNKKMLTDHIVIRDGEIVYTDVQINIVLDKTNRSQEGSIQERIRNRMSMYFSLNNWEYGQILRDSDVVKVLSDIKEIDQIDVVFTSEKSIESGAGTCQIVSPKFNEIIRPDNISVSFSYK